MKVSELLSKPGFTMENVVILQSVIYVHKLANGDFGEERAVEAREELGSIAFNLIKALDINQ